MPFNVYTIYRWLQPRFRARRTELFLKVFRPTEATRILDIGGMAYDWRELPVGSHITVLNLDPSAPTPDTQPQVHCVKGDGRCLLYEDFSFDIAYSNSVIEHLGSFESQKQFAAEARRVAKQLFVQTPNRWFPVEPHFLTLFVHFLPKKIQRRLIRFCSIRGWLRRADNVGVIPLFEELRLLTFRELQELFPDCRIYREKFLGLTKSFIAIRTTET